MQTFTASRISSDDNVLYPDVLQIDKDLVIYSKWHVVGYRAKAVRRRNIASVSVRAHIFFSDVVISTTGDDYIVARGFTKSDAIKIVKILS